MNHRPPNRYELVEFVQRIQPELTLQAADRLLDMVAPETLHDLATRWIAERWTAELFLEMHFAIEESRTK